MRAEGSYSSGFGVLRRATGVDAPLILDYQKSGVAHTGCPARHGFAHDVEGKFKATTGLAIRCLAQWLALAANDFWYPSMRRPPKTAAARVKPHSRIPSF